MSKRTSKLYLEDIVTSIENIEDYIKGMAFNGHGRKRARISRQNI